MNSHFRNCLRYPVLPFNMDRYPHKKWLARPSYFYNEDAYADKNASSYWDGPQFWSATQRALFMMTSSNGNIFRVTGPLCGEFTGHRWIPLRKAGDAELWYFLWHGWVNSRDTRDLRHHRAHYDVTVMLRFVTLCLLMVNLPKSFTVSIH